MDSIKPNTPSWKSLFYFTTQKHLAFLLPAICSAVLAGLAIPANAYVLGKVFGQFTKYGTGTIDAAEFKHSVNKYNLYLLAIASGCWFFNSGAFCLWHTFGDLQARSARERLFNALLKHQIGWFDLRKDGIGALSSRLLTHVNELKGATSQPLSLMVQYLSTTCGSFGLAFFVSWKLTLVIVATVPLTAILVPFFSSRIQPNIQAQASKLSEASKLTTNSFSSIETVKCYTGEDSELRSYSTIITEAGRFFIRQAYWNALQGSTIRLATLCMFVQGFWYGGVLIDRGAVTPADVLTAFWAAVLATQTLMQSMPNLVMLERGRSAAQRLRVIMVQLESDTAPSANTRPERCVGDVTLTKVVFSYPSRPQHTILHQVDLFFAAGETTFVVGKSGSGKSTIGQLLLKFYRPDDGTIVLDGRQLSELDGDWVRDNVHLVEQQSILFNATVYENIALGRSGREVTHQDVLDAAEFAKVRKLIEDMPEGFDTMVGSKGESLSGGQRQRIALARARLRDPPILILDESTSALDYVNRIAIMDAIRGWRKGKTTIVITHDISQILPDEFVYVMRDGRVVEEGFRNALNAAEGSPFYDFITTMNEADDSFQDNFEDLADLIKPLGADDAGWGDSRPSTPPYDDLLDMYLSEPDDRPSSIIPEYFTQPMAANRPESVRVPRIIAPFWRVMPATTSATAVVNSSSSSRQNSLTDSAADINTLDSESEGLARMLNATRHIVAVPLETVSKQVHRLSTLHKEPISKQESIELELRPVAKKEERKGKSKKRRAKSLKTWSLRRIIATIWPRFNWRQRAYLITAIISTIIWALCTPMFSFIFSKLLSTIYVPQERKTKALKYSLGVLGIAFTDAISNFVSQSQFQRCGQLWTNSIRVQAMRSILAQPRQFFDEDRNSVSRLAEHLDYHAEEMQHILGRFLGYMLTVAVMISTAVIWSLATCWKLTLVLMACSPVMYGIANAMKVISRVWDKRCVDAAEVVGTIFVETFTSIKTVHSLTLGVHFRRKHTTACDRTLSLGIQRAIYCGIFFGLSEAALIYLTALVFFYGAILVTSGAWPLNGIFQVFTLLLFSISNSTMILAFIPSISVSQDAAGRLFRLVALPGTSHEHEGDVRITSIGDIALHNVNFYYPSRPDAPVLRNVNLSIPPGTCVALVGLSGSGKSTIASLLLNLYPIAAFADLPLRRASASNNESDITFSNRSIKRIHTPTLRSLIAIVSQTTTLFPASVAANIAYGLDPSSPLHTPENISAAAQAAGVHDFIASLPHGYDTLIGDGGTGVSGGQAQRIAIARALVRRPDVLIFDEATSALDVESAALIRDTLRALFAADRAGSEASGHSGRGKLTVIIITHARDMMRVADWICMLDQGRVVEVGAYEELVRLGGRFGKLVKGQAWEKEDARMKRESLARLSRVQGVICD